MWRPAVPLPPGRRQSGPWHGCGRNPSQGPDGKALPADGGRSVPCADAPAAGRSGLAGRWRSVPSGRADGAGPPQGPDPGTAPGAVRVCARTVPEGPAGHAGPPPPVLADGPDARAPAAGNPAAGRKGAPNASPADATPATAPRPRGAVPYGAGRSPAPSCGGGGLRDLVCAAATGRTGRRSCRSGRRPDGCGPAAPASSLRPCGR